MPCLSRPWLLTTGPSLRIPFSSLWLTRCKPCQAKVLMLSRGCRGCKPRARSHPPLARRAGEAEDRLAGDLAGDPVGAVELPVEDVIAVRLETGDEPPAAGLNGQDLVPGAVRDVDPRRSPARRGRGE